MIKSVKTGLITFHRSQTIYKKVKRIFNSKTFHRLKILFLYGTLISASINTFNYLLGFYHSDSLLPLLNNQSRLSAGA